jgi:thiosulfate dehydrogenase
MNTKPIEISRRRTWLLAALLALPTPALLAAETESLIARGGRLYDNWWLEKEISKPKEINPAFPNQDLKFYADSWRCKECHGWDYLGKNGEYGLGEHFTGIKGINGAIGKDPAAIASILRDKNHGYTPQQLNDKDLADLALFVSRGQVNLTPFLDRTGKPKGLAVRGEVYYNTICAGCHKLDGKGEIRSLGDVSENHAEALHKIFNGQPGEGMPALRALEPQIVLDIATYLTWLPKGKRRLNP